MSEYFRSFGYSTLTKHRGRQKQNTVWIFRPKILRASWHQSGRAWTHSTVESARLSALFLFCLPICCTYTRDIYIHSSRGIRQNHFYSRVMQIPTFLHKNIRHVFQIGERPANTHIPWAEKEWESNRCAKSKYATIIMNKCKESMRERWRQEGREGARERGKNKTTAIKLQNDANTTKYRRKPQIEF